MSAHTSLKSTAALLGVAAVAAAGTVPAAALAAPTATEVATIANASTVSSARGYLAVLTGTGKQRTLQIVHSGTTEAAKGVGKLPNWAIPHVGIDGGQKTTVLYPRCTSSALTSCDLYRYDVLTKKEKKLASVNTSGGELEAAMDHGNLIFTRYDAAQRKSYAGSRRLFGLGKGTKTPRLLSASGGFQLAISGADILQVRDVDPTAGVCGDLRLQALKLSGGAATELFKTTCGMDGQQIVSPGIADGKAIWGWRSLEEKGRLYRRGLTGGTRETATLDHWPAALAVAGADTIYLLDDGFQTSTQATAKVFRLGDIDWTSESK